MACVILSLLDLRDDFVLSGGAIAPEAVCVRFNHVVSPAVGFQATSGNMVVHAVSSAVFYFQWVI